MPPQAYRAEQMDTAVPRCRRTQVFSGRWDHERLEVHLSSLAGAPGNYQQAQTQRHSTGRGVPCSNVPGFSAGVQQHSGWRRHINTGGGGP